MTDPTTPTEHAELHALWREAAEKRIDGADWPSIVLDLLQHLDRVKALVEEAKRVEGIVITPGFTTYYAVDAGLLDEALRPFSGPPSTPQRE